MPKNFRCLVIAVPEATLPEGVSRTDDMLSIGYDDLASVLPVPETVELVVAPLFCPEFDALEIIEALGSSGFRGQLRVIAPKLPNRQIVLRELRAYAVRQGISLELVETPPPEASTP
ncbi:MAG: hypothetical protein MUE52_10700 [Tabrizicola sp.]|nr:hypothetical protein [Tabrizicola sp.]